MLHCGHSWQPTKILRVIENIPTSARPVKVQTDGGIGFLKGLGNPAGSVALASELVCGELAVWLGLRVPEFCIIDVKGLRISIEGGAGEIGQGPAFLSREVRGTVADGSGTLLKKLVNPDAISRLVIFDTWVRNWDRYNPEDQTPRSNLDNLLFSPVKRRLELVVFDHSHCFSEAEIDLSINSPELVEDPRVYGLFPCFAPYIKENVVRDALMQLRSADRGVIGPILASIPPQWDVPEPVRRAWTDMICERAAFLAPNLGERLLAQRTMDL